MVFNPGILTDTSYFSDADFIVEFEDGYSSFSATKTPLTIPQQLRARSAILVHDTPTSADLGEIAKTVAGDGVGMLYLSSDCCWNGVGLIGALASAVAAV